MWNRGVLPTAETKIVDGREDVSLGFLLWNEPDWRQLTANEDVLEYLALVSARVRLPDHSWEFGFRFVTSSALGGGATPQRLRHASLQDFNTDWTDFSLQLTRGAG